MVINATVIYHNFHWVECYALLSIHVRSLLNCKVCVHVRADIRLIRIRSLTCKWMAVNCQNTSVLWKFRKARSHTTTNTVDGLPESNKKNWPLLAAAMDLRHLMCARSWNHHYHGYVQPRSAHLFRAVSVWAVNSLSISIRYSFQLCSFLVNCPFSTARHWLIVCVCPLLIELCLSVLLARFDSK